MSAGVGNCQGSFIHCAVLLAAAHCVRCRAWQIHQKWILWKFTLLLVLPQMRIQVCLGAAWILQGTQMLNATPQ